VCVVFFYRLLAQINNSTTAAVDPLSGRRSHGF
jgi:hypothetical protein